MQEAVSRATADGRRKWLLGWEAAYVFTINVTETGYVKAASNTFPIPAPPGLLTLGVGGGLTRTSKRIAKLSFTPKLSDIKNYDCNGVEPIPGHPFVSSRIGFSEWLVRALDAADPDQPQGVYTPKGSQPINVGHTFEFVIDANGSISPTYLVAAGAATLTPSGSYDRSDDDTLDVTFAASKDGTTKTSGKTVAPVTITVKLSDADIKKIVDAEKRARSASAQVTSMRAIQAQLLAKDDIKLESLPNIADILGNESVQGKLSPERKETIRMKLDQKIDSALAEQVQAEDEAKRTRSKSDPRTVLKTVPIETTTVTSAVNNISAQEALQQLQLERLLSGPRSP